MVKRHIVYVDGTQPAGRPQTLTIPAAKGVIIDEEVVRTRVSLITGIPPAHVRIIEIRDADKCERKGWR